MQKTGSSYTRRRALSILAAGAALPLAGKAAFGTQMRGAITIADELGDAGTADLFTALSQDADKQLWFVEAHLQTK